MNESWKKIAKLYLVSGASTLTYMTSIYDTNIHSTKYHFTRPYNITIVHTSKRT
jgi:hypothetical protein